MNTIIMNTTNEMYDLSNGQLLINDEIELSVNKMSRALYEFTEEEVDNVKTATEYKILPVEIELSGKIHAKFLEVTDPTTFNCKILHSGSTDITSLSDCVTLAVTYNEIADTTTCKVLPKNALIISA